jgi:hypothetical protein
MNREGRATDYGYEGVATMRSLIKTTGLALFAMILSVSARAQNVEVGSGIYCDSQKQVERFVALFHGDAEATINTVNAEMKNPTACIAATIAFIRGPEVAIARTRHVTFHIVQVFVIGVLTEAGVPSTTPSATFSIVRIEERDA